MIANGEIWVHIGVSLRRVLVGYLLGIVTAIPIGVAMGRSKIVENLLSPPLQYMRNITPLAIIPFAVNAFTVGEPSKYFVIWYGSIITIILNTATGVLLTPKIRIRAAQCLGASPRDIFFRIVMPSAWPFILTGLRVALGFCFMGVVAAEMVAAESGIGFLIMQSRNMLLPEQMFIGLFTLGLVGLFTDRLFHVSIRRLMKRYMIMIEKD
jgi:ABC-type nitrate/sulfonate/bicarbonate transport system permease component